MKKILFVCTGNICRSPAAEFLFNARAEEAGVPIRAESAGVAAEVGMGVSEGSARLLEKRGFDLSGHRARQVTAAMMKAAERVYALDAGHLAALKRLFPEYTTKTVLLRADAGLPGASISDPWGGDAAAYQAADKQIDEAVSILVKRESHAQNPR